MTPPPRSDALPDADAFISGLPKAELHMHLEGSIEPELMLDLARRNDVRCRGGRRKS